MAATFNLASYRAFNDRLAAQYPELATERAHREALAQLRDARQALSRRDLRGAIATVIDVLDGQVA